MSGNNIKVVCRFRPQNKMEIREGGVPIIEISENGTGITLKVIVCVCVCVWLFFAYLNIKTQITGKRYKFFFI